jgi:hypothetical protein
LIFSRKNSPLTSLALSRADHYYFLHHEHSHSLVRFSGEGDEVLLSIRASLSSNKKVFLFDRVFSFEDFLKEIAKNSVNHFALHHGVLLLLPSLKNRLSITLLDWRNIQNDLGILASILKNKA